MNKGIILLLCSVLIASVSQIILKKSADSKHESFIKEYLNARVIIGYGMMFASTFFSIFAYRYVEYKNGPLIESLGYLFVMILSAIFLSEKITKKKVIGNLVILLGLIVFYLP